MIYSDAGAGEMADAAFEEYLSRIDAGESVDIAAFLRAHAECAEELRQAINAEQCLRAIGGVLSPRRDQTQEKKRPNVSGLDSTQIAPELEDDSSDREGDSPQSNWEIPHELGEYQLLQPLARGGMGLVFKARQKSLGRVVAVKVMLDRWLATESAIQRFRSEAQLASRLQHPHIVSIYEIGEQGGRFFFSMEFVSGKDLLQILRENPVSPRRSAEIMVCVAEAMEYAHGEGLLHRDLKPSNILIDERNRPRITDFGLACTLGDATDLTRTGEILGTASYMSPEQAMGSRSQELGPTSDVYSLGAVLYALLVGHPPFQADNSLDTLLQVREQDPIAPAKLNSKVPRDLDTICLKCLAKSPSQRYQSAQELADDLSRFLKGEPIHARRASVGMVAWRWCCRHRAAALGLAMSFLLLTILVCGVFVYGIHTDRLNNQLLDSNTELTETRGVLLDSQFKLKTALKRVTESRDESLKTQKRLRELLYAADLRAAGRAYNEQDYREVIRLLNRQIPQTGEADFRGPEWYLLNRLVAPRHVSLEGHAGDVYAVAFSHDGRWLASGGEDTTLRIYHAETFELYATIRTGFAAVRGVAFDPSGQTLAAACFDGNVHIFDVDSKQKRLTFPAHPEQAWDLAWTPEGKTLVTSGKDDWVRLWDPRTGNQLAKIGPHEAGKAVRRVAISRDGRLLATACDRNCTVWDLKTGKAIFSQTDATRVTCVDFSPDSRQTAFGTLTGHVYQASWDPRRHISLFGEYEDAVEAVTFSPNGDFLASVDRGGVLSTSRLAQVPLATNVPQAGLHQAFAHEGRVLSVALSTDGQCVATAGQDGVVRVWNMDDLDQPNSLLHPSGFQCARYLPDGNLLAGNDDGVFLWNLKTRTQNNVTPLPCRSIAVSPDGKRCVTGSLEGTLSLYDFAAAKVLKETKFENLGLIGDLAFTADGSQLIALTDLELLILDPETLEKREGVTKIRCNSMAVSPDGKTLAVSRKGQDNIEFWDLESFVKIKAFPGHNAVVKSLRFSRDGKWIASGSEDRLIKVWRVEDGQLIWTLSGHRGRVFGVDFSADGKTLFSSGLDGTLRLWSLALGQELLTLNPNQDIPFRREHHVTVSPDGTAVLHNRLGILLDYQLSVEGDRER